MEVKFVKGKKAAGPPVAVNLRTTKAGITGNPWIDRRHFDVMMARCVQAEDMCKRLIAVIAVDDGEFLASHDYDYLAAGHAVLKGDV